MQKKVVTLRSWGFPFVSRFSVFDLFIWLFVGFPLPPPPLAPLKYTECGGRVLSSRDKRKRIQLNREEKCDGFYSCVCTLSLSFSLSFIYTLCVWRAEYTHLVHREKERFLSAMPKQKAIPLSLFLSAYSAAFVESSVAQGRLWQRRRQNYMKWNFSDECITFKLFARIIFLVNYFAIFQNTLPCGGGGRSAHCTYLCGRGGGIPGGDEIERFWDFPRTRSLILTEMY